MSERFAYVSMITNDGFVPGVQALIKSLRKVSQVEICVLIGEKVSNTSRKSLERMEVHLYPVGNIPCPSKLEGVNPCWENAEYTKLNIWSLVQYDFICYLDADCIVLENIDEVFHRNTDFAACPDIFPPDRFNAGVLLVRPNLLLFEKLVEQSGRLESYDGGDTGFLNAFFPGWYLSGPESKLPFRYNAQRTMYYFTKKSPGYWNSVKPIKVLHFSSSPKPWDAAALQSNRQGELERLWWEIFSGIDSKLF